MKKTIILSIILTSLILSSCTEATPTNEDYKQVNESFTNTGNTDNGVEKAVISNDTNYEATEEPEEVSSGETATVTSFGSGGTDNESGSGQ